MAMKFYRIVIHGPQGDREVRVASPTDVQAADAAAPLLKSDERLGAIVQVDDDGLQHADAPPPKTQAEELSDITPGMAAATRPGR